MVLLCLTTISREKLRKLKKIINIKIRENTTVLCLTAISQEKIKLKNYENTKQIKSREN